jgi:glycine/D-amino acid oxidase-like deaminating enzyme
LDGLICHECLRRSLAGRIIEDAVTGERVQVGPAEGRCECAGCVADRAEGFGGIVEPTSQMKALSSLGLVERDRSWVGLCPFHPDTVPSFTVSKVHGVYHCFGCGAHGNLLDLMQADLVRALVRRSPEEEPE